MGLTKDGYWDRDRLCIYVGILNFQTNAVTRQDIGYSDTWTRRYAVKLQVMIPYPSGH